MSDVINVVGGIIFYIVLIYVAIRVGGGPGAARTGQAGSSTVKRAWPQAGQRTAGPGMGTSGVCRL
jgi:hypothetical protein